MEVIKFRVFIKQWNIFKYWGFLNNCFVGPPTGSGLTLEYCSNNSEQFIEAHDTNGIEIYKGDILRLDFDESFSNIKPGFIGVVKYLESSFVVDSGYDAHTVFQEIATWEIIGNVHQNPELK